MLREISDTDYKTLIRFIESVKMTREIASAEGCRDVLRVDGRFLYRHKFKFNLECNTTEDKLDYLVKFWCEKHNDPEHKSYFMLRCYFSSIKHQILEVADYVSGLY